MTLINPCPLRKLAISLGSNLPSKFGDPSATLIKIRPEIEKNIQDWLYTFKNTKSDLDKIQESLKFHWSPLFETDPLGGPSNQPNFINAVLVIEGKLFSSIVPSEQKALQLLERFLKLEELFGRNRKEDQTHWGPRTIDIDLLTWGELQMQTTKLIIPHPRLTERTFVLIPLAAALNATQKLPKKISPIKGWNE